MPRAVPLLVITGLLAGRAPAAAPEPGDRLAWWRHARFGIFIHWGLYAIPAGSWKGRTVGGIGEWIQHVGRIPPDEYADLLPQFNPVRFDAGAWAALFAESGAGYVVITTKHHDGFCLFDSAQTGYDVMGTPFGRDVMKEIAEACRARGLRIGWYHSILDWHHPDYLPRQDWDPRPAEGADFDRYRAYLAASVRELLTDYGEIGVMWFDGEWEPTWTHADGLALDALVRGLQPRIIVNNRVDKGRAGMAGLTRGGGFAGDFGTPEQEVPAEGLPGVDWESCMTMNDTWGYRADDHNWKSSTALIRTLAEVASKGGNFLLNVGPTAQGEVPAPSVDRLRAIGRWMAVNGESIRGTDAGPFEHLTWGRCTRRSIAGGATRLYLHVFEWPGDGALVVPGIANRALGAWLLGDPGRSPLEVSRREDALVIALPGSPPDAADSVVVLDVADLPDTCAPPTFDAPGERFVDEMSVTIHGGPEGTTARCTLDGRTPGPGDPPALGPIGLTATTTVAARLFRGAQPVSGERRATFTRVEPRRGLPGKGLQTGLAWACYEADCNRVADLAGRAPAASGVAPVPGVSPRTRDDHFGLVFRGFLSVTARGMYRLTVSADDGAVLRIGGETIVDNDGIHAAVEKSGLAALDAGLHPIEVLYFEKGGLEALQVWIEGPGMERRPVDASMFLH
jgi:alpha-L-fucosidase